MYEYLNGVIVNVNSKNIVVDVNGVGYLVNVANCSDFNLNDTTKVYVHQIVKEDSHTLYGFSSKEQKDIFLMFLSVKGIGPKGALAPLSAAKASDIYNAINNGDIKYFTSFTGIGTKAANQIILDLQGKVKVDLLSDYNPELADATDALIALGYKKNEISNAFKKVDSNLGLNDLIKEALKVLSGN